MIHHKYENKKAHDAKPGSTGAHWKSRCKAGGGAAPVAPSNPGGSPPPANPSPFKCGGKPKFERRAAGGAAKARRDYPFTKMQ